MRCRLTAAHTPAHTHPLACTQIRRVHRLLTTTPPTANTLQVRQVEGREVYGRLRQAHGRHLPSQLLFCGRQDAGRLPDVVGGWCSGCVCRPGAGVSRRVCRGVCRCQPSTHVVLPRARSGPDSCAHMCCCCCCPRVCATHLPRLQAVQAAGLYVPGGLLPEGQGHQRPVKGACAHTCCQTVRKCKPPVRTRPCCHVKRGAGACRLRCKS
jgi:hypothetical protein